jgi:c(7)-type cytochrome triheme protein
MLRNSIKYFLALLLLSSAVGAVAGEYIMEPAPADRSRHTYMLEPGELKRDKYGMIDSSPDVLSLEYLPKDEYGFVDWAKAIKDGVIKPRDSISGRGAKKAEPLFDKRVVRRVKRKFMPDVVFPHAQHTIWLKCSTCHPKIFKMKAGSTPMTMNKIWNGEFCGRCHDRVAFPTRNCFKCHSALKSYDSQGVKFKGGHEVDVPRLKLKAKPKKKSSW